MNRPLWFGVALFSAFGSIFAGMFELRPVNYVLLAVALGALVMAFRADAPPPVEDPRKK
jgi:hypothetical protein